VEADSFWLIGFLADNLSSAVLELGGAGADELVFLAADPSEKNTNLGSKVFKT
jgi:hypothetical protein